MVLEVTGNCCSGGCGPQDRTCLWDMRKGAPGRGGPLHPQTQRDGGSGAGSCDRGRPSLRDGHASLLTATPGSPQNSGPSGARQATPAADNQPGAPGLGCGLRQPLLGAAPLALCPSPSLGSNTLPCEGWAQLQLAFRPASCFPASRWHRRQRQRGGAAVPLCPPAPISALAPCVTHLFPATGGKHRVYSTCRVTD